LRFFLLWLALCLGAVPVFPARCDDGTISSVVDARWESLSNAWAKPVKRGKTRREPRFFLDRARRKRVH